MANDIRRLECSGSHSGKFQMMCNTFNYCSMHNFHTSLNCQIGVNSLCGKVTDTYIAHQISIIVQLSSNHPKRRTACEFKALKHHTCSDQFNVKEAICNAPHMEKVLKKDISIGVYYSVHKQSYSAIQGTVVETQFALGWISLCYDDIDDKVHINASLYFILGW